MTSQMAEMGEREQVRLRAHDATNLFPMMLERDLEELTESIREHGQQVPIVLHEGLILDGRNRWLACQRAGTEPLTVQWTGEDGSPTAFVIAMNLHRRHLTSAQRAAVAAEALPLFEQEARQRQGTRNDLRGDFREQFPGSQASEERRARDEAADAFQVNPHYISDAKRLQQQAPEVFNRLKSGEWTMPEARTAARIKEAAPDVFERVTAGEIALPEARQFVMPEPPKETEEERAFYALARQRLVTRLDAEAVAAACHSPEADLPGFESLAEWLEGFNACLRTRIARPLRAVK